MARSKTTTERIDACVKVLFRNVLYVAQQRRALSDVNSLVINGLIDLSLDPQVGILSDPSANYTSEDTIAEMLDIAAEEVCLETAAMMQQADVLAFTLDESTCNSNLSQLLIYST